MTPSAIAETMRRNGLPTARGLVASRPAPVVAATTVRRSDGDNGRRYGGKRHAPSDADETEIKNEGQIQEVAMPRTCARLTICVVTAESRMK
jgi:hypothetical protein